MTDKAFKALISRTLLFLLRHLRKYDGHFRDESEDLFKEWLVEEKRAAEKEGEMG